MEGGGGGEGERHYIHWCHDHGMNTILRDTMYDQRPVFINNTLLWTDVVIYNHATKENSNGISIHYKIYMSDEVLERLNAH